MTAPSQPVDPDVAMPVVQEIKLPTPLKLDETEDQSDDDLEECGGEWSKALPPPPPTQPVESEELEVPTEPTEPNATEETGTTAATVPGTRKSNRASTTSVETVVTCPRRAAATATVETAVTRPRRAAATATVTKAAAAEVAKLKTAADKAKEKAKSKAPAKAKSPAKAPVKAPAKTPAKQPIQKRGRAAASPDDADTRKTKTRRGGETGRFKLLLSTAFDAETTKKLTAKIKKLGGVTTTSSKEFTHFLTAPPLGRSKNVLCALASGAPVVLPSWLDASALAGTFVSPENHSCRHPQFEKKQQFDLPSTLEQARGSPLFYDVKAHIIPGKGGNKAAGSRASSRRGKKEDAAQDEPEIVAVDVMLREVLPRAGCVLVEKASEVEKVSSAELGSKQWLIVQTPTSDPAVVKKLKARGAKVVSHESVMSAIVRHKRL